MRFRKRDAAASRPDPVARFWQWWAETGRAAAERGIDGGGFDDFVPGMTRHVQAIHRDLVWELAAGHLAEHAVVVSAGGVPALRRLAEQWYQRAPQPTATWEYHPARQAEPAGLGQVLEMAGQRLELDELRLELTVRDERHVIDTTVYHPTFGAMPANARTQVGFLILDWTLGEDGVTRWVGEFDTATELPPAVVTVDVLMETVAALASRTSDSNWTLLRGERDGRVVIASAASPARWIDHPLLDLHVGVTLPFADQTTEGLPGASALDQLRALEDVITTELGERALLRAHETTRGVRTVHLYADSLDVSVPADVERFIAGWPGAVVKTAHDPGWTTIQHLTGLRSDPNSQVADK